MNTKNRKNKKKINLLEVSDSERNNVIEKLRQTLRQSVAETRLWNALLQCETLTINGQVVFSEESSLDGLLMQKTDL
jgi:tRNA A37 threonylcarbamoyladenosine dehydratase